MSETAAVATVDAAALEEKRLAIRQQLDEEMGYLPDDLRKELRVLIKAGFFNDGKDQVKAIYAAAAKIGIGKSIGLNAQAALRGVILQSNGMPTFSANTMAVLIKKSGRYDYSYSFQYDDKGNPTGCKIVFEKLRDGQWVPAGESEFTKKDADLAGLSGKETFKKYPKNMFFARCMTNGAKWAAPDVFEGHVAYLPDEVPDFSVPVNYETLEPVVEIAEVVAKPKPAGKASPLVEQLMRETKTDEHVVLSMFNVRSLADLTDDQAGRLTDMLTKKKQATPGAVEAAVAA